MKKYSQESVVGIFVVVGLLAIAALAVKLGHVGLWGDDTYRLYARFTKVTGLRVGNPVNTLGLPIGSVAGFKIDQEDQVAIVEFKLNKEITVYDDAIASIKTEGLIGDKYVDIDLGGGGEKLAPGEMITETVSPVDLGDMIGKYAFGDAGS